MKKFMVNYSFHGRASKVIEAESLEAAEAAVEQEVEKDDFEIEPDDIDDVNFNINQMYPVTRDRKEIWTTYVRSDDKRGHQSALAGAPLFAAKGGA